MDRSSFIQQNYSKHTNENSCGQQDCVCVEANVNQRSIKANLSHLAVLGVLALLCAFVFAEFKSHDALIKSDQWLIEKKSFVVSCSSELKKDDKTTNEQQPNRNSENNCSHSQAASLSETNNTKRRSLKTHNC